MVLAHLSPAWFFGYDVLLELAFAIICMLVGVFSYKLYHETDQRLLRYFGLSFILISISYLIQSIFNFLIVSKLNENICHFIKIQSVTTFEFMGLLTHMFFMTVGLSILFFTTLKSRKIRILWAIMTISLISIFYGQNNLYLFYIISSILLGFISWHYLFHYLKRKQTKTLMVALAFLFLFFGNFHFLISVDHSISYVVGHILELFAYMFILINLYLVRR